MNTQKDSKSEKSADNPLTPDNVFVAKISPGIYAIGANADEPDAPDDRDSDLRCPKVEMLLARGALANKIKEWENKLIVKKLDPWKFFGIVDVKIMKYEPGRLIHYRGKELEFEDSPQRVFWDFIEPFLENGINWWLDYVADLCLQRGKEPKPYLQTVKNALNVCIHDVYLRMSDIDYKLRKGAVACRASEHFGKNIQRKDVRDKTTFMINYLNDRYKEVLATAEADLAKQPAGTGRDAKRMIGAIIISLLVACIFELSVWFVPVTPFTWLKNHPNSYGLQGAIVLLVPCIVVGVLKRQYRKWCLRTAAISLVLLILSLLGGRSSS